MQVCLQAGCSPGCVTEARRDHEAAGALRRISVGVAGLCLLERGAAVASSPQAAGSWRRCSSSCTRPDTAVETQP